MTTFLTLTLEFWYNNSAVMLSMQSVSNSYARFLTFWFPMQYYWYDVLPLNSLIVIIYLDQPQHLIPSQINTLINDSITHLRATLKMYVILFQYMIDKLRQSTHTFS